MSLQRSWWSPNTMLLGEHHERTAPLAETCPRRPARLPTYTRVVRRHLVGRWATRVLSQQRRGNNIQHARHLLVLLVAVNMEPRAAGAGSPRQCSPLRRPAREDGRFS